MTSSPTATPKQLFTVLLAGSLVLLVVHTLGRFIYTPLLPYFAHHAEDGAFRILADDYVSTESGTGIVHLAPAFDEYTGVESRQIRMHLFHFFTGDHADFPHLRCIGLFCTYPVEGQALYMIILEKADRALTPVTGV